jgi:putative transposase
LAKVFRELKSPSLAIGSADDHIHILCSLGRTIEIAKLVEEIKTESSKWIKTRAGVPELSLAKRVWCVFYRTIAG